jgi:hypothetical protein
MVALGVAGCSAAGGVIRGTHAVNAKSNTLIAIPLFIFVDPLLV